MPWSKKFQCPDCGHVWTDLLRHRTDKSSCPQCPAPAAPPVEQLAAPRIGRGAAPETGTRIDGLSKTQKIDLAMRIASEDNGGANFETKSRAGEAIAMPVRTAEGVSLNGSWGQGLGGGAKVPLDYGTAASAASADAFRGRNSNLLDAMARDRKPYMRPVYRTPK